MHSESIFSSWNAFHDSIGFYGTYALLCYTIGIFSMVLYLVYIQSSLVDYFTCQESARAGYPVAKYRTLTLEEWLYRIFGQKHISLTLFIPSISYKSMEKATEEFLEKSK